VKELNVVNGCQSLSTIYSCSEAIRNNNGYIMFRFYEITNPEKADKISTCTNSQSAVKARDLRSNDKYVLAMKKAYELCYPDGYFITKRGEQADKAKYNANHIISLTELGKQLIAWHSQRPTISYSETKIFDKYFDQIFRKDYAPENIQALNELSKCVIGRWNNDNPLGLNDSLLAMKAYAPHHHLYTISIFFCEVNKMPESVPNPAKALEKLKESELLDDVVDMAGRCLNAAFETASAETSENGKIFSPQNWIKAKGSLKDIRLAVKNILGSWQFLPGGKETMEKINNGLKMDTTDFENRWTAD
jgi:RNA polymerase-interacting CarD/CdnL/TRCF family regulator